MLKLQLHQSNHAPSTKLFPNTLSRGHGCLALPLLPAPVNVRRPVKNAGRIRASVVDTGSPTVFTHTEKSFPVTALVTVKLTVGGFFSNLGLSRGLDDITDLLGKTLLLELVSAKLDPKTGKEKPTIESFAHRVKEEDDIVTYEAKFTISKDFGDLGAVLVTNEHHKEMHLESITFTGFPYGPVNITCNSWVHAKSDNPEKRIFFTNKSYLPLETPGGLKVLREKALHVLRGDGIGQRKVFERIYDYDTYNDLGDTDKSQDLARPVLGGKDFPYPRRCRTGRPSTKSDPTTESRSNSVYVPRDESFSEVKQLTFSAKTFKSVMHVLVPILQSSLEDKKQGFPFFTAIDSLFNEGMSLPKSEGGNNFFSDLLPRLVKAIAETGDDVLLFETPELLEKDKFSWIKDEEFSRQTLSGINPMAIRLVTEFPLKSKLDPEVYGPAESRITKEIVEREIRGVMTVEEALKRKKLFVLDYHDLLLPYVHKVRDLEDTTLYGSRTLFFLTRDSTLRPIAIELTRPKSDTQAQWAKVYTRGYDATECWLWKLAKAHVSAHDAGYHQLVSHWLSTHCATEPYIIAANRTLSAIHPIYRLLHPHFRYTMEINALAREALINSSGIIESSFSPGKYSMELSSVAYDKLWRFDTQSLPGDLVSRGMAVEDPKEETGLKLIIEDYPYANDALLVWSSIKEWVNDYVSHYYPDPSLITSDTELQSWWTEVKTKGHPDKKEGWPSLKTPSDLVHILTTIIWVASGHHAAVNFGQYSYAGYFPNRPTIARKNMPDEDLDNGDEETFERFVEKPEQALLDCFPSQRQATVVMAILDVLSNHSPDEEYLSEKPEPAWTEEPAILAAYERFNGRLKEIEGIIDGRNSDKKLRNRTGAGIVPYTLLKPFSEAGVTGKGVPNSISI
ncbi:linoleate 13S-lipoxygenase 2-1, chloroplastic-like [Aristolochia californica]|uniref:linoleate 13S-lipoxygenase 2-1, chloroplastic-like n=1 Tax=Aristolochia californica TaxID=171875 RepID=UPI0035E0ABC9